MRIRDKQNIHCMAKANSSSCSGEGPCAKDEFCDVVVRLCQPCSVCSPHDAIQVAAGCSRCPERYNFPVAEPSSVTGTIMERAFIPAQPAATQNQAYNNLPVIILLATVISVLVLIVLVIVVTVVHWRMRLLKSRRRARSFVPLCDNSRASHVSETDGANVDAATQQTSFMVPTCGISPSDDNINTVPASPSVDDSSLTQHLRRFSQSAQCVVTTLWSSCTTNPQKTKKALVRHSDVKQFDGPNNKKQGCCEAAESQPMLNAESATMAAIAATEECSDKGVIVIDCPCQSVTVLQETSLNLDTVKSEFLLASECHSSLQYLQLETDKNAASIHLPSSHRSPQLVEISNISKNCNDFNGPTKVSKHTDDADNFTKSYHVERRRSSLGVPTELCKWRDADQLDSSDRQYRTVHTCDGIGISLRSSTPNRSLCLAVDLQEGQPSYISDDESQETPAKQLVGKVVPSSFPEEVVNQTMDSNACCMEKTNGSVSVSRSPGDVSIDLQEKSFLQLSMVDDGIPNDGQSDMETSSPVCELSSLDSNLISRIFSWLDGQAWAIEYYADSPTKVTIGVEGISHEAARRQLEAAGFYRTALVIQLTEPQFTGAVYTPTPHHRTTNFQPQQEVVDVGTQIIIQLHPGERIATDRKEAVLGAAIYVKPQSTSAPQLAITVGHLFDKVGDSCYNTDKALIGHCVVLQTDDIKSSSHGRMLADIAIVRIEPHCGIQNVVTVPVVGSATSSSNDNAVEYQLQLSEARDAMPVMVRRCDDGAWQRGIVHKTHFTLKFRNGTSIQNAVQVARSGSVLEKITDEGDSGNLVFSQPASTSSYMESAAAAASGIPTLNVCAMVTGVLDLPGGNSFTIGSRLSDVLSAISSAPENAAVFASSELTLSPNVTGKQVLNFEFADGLKQPDSSHDSGVEA